MNNENPELEFISTSVPENAAQHVAILTNQATLASGDVVYLPDGCDFASVPICFTQK